jgi:hypothetical protein
MLAVGLPHPHIGNTCPPHTPVIARNVDLSNQHATARADDESCGTNEYRCDACYHACPGSDCGSANIPFRGTRATDA